MRRLLSILCAILLLAFYNQVGAQSLMQTAKKAEQRVKELKRQEAARYSAILDSKDLSKYNQYIADYPRGENTPEIKRRADEIRKWDSAKYQNTIASYEEYLNSTSYHWYDSEATSAIRSLKQAAEKQAWEKVLATNSIEAYQQYLKDNPTTGYRDEAERAIERLQAANVWHQIKGSNDIDKIQQFINSYPNAEEVSLAQTLIHELLGCKYYNNGDLDAAYVEFSQIDRNDVSFVNRKAYDEVMEYDEFSDLGSYSSEESLLNFMEKYPYGKYYSEASNLLAINKAQNLGDYATTYDYNQALSYARDTYTRNSVQSYISLNKKKQKERERALKSWKREQNGGTVNLGLDFMDLAFNGSTDDGMILYYNIGLLLRFGNYKDWVQFAIGVKPGFILYDSFYHDYYQGYYQDYYYDYTETETAFHMPIIGQLKLNLIKTSENSRFFIHGQYLYNAVRVDDFESEMSWAAGLGFAWKHFDWSFYYRQDIGNPIGWEYDKQHYFGMSLTYYWKL